jgi:pantoate--beta-alanine ligase
MRVIKSIAKMKEYSSALRKEGKSIGLIPTLGALHEGHTSLLPVADEVCDVSVMSVFVNPAQFGPSEDFEKYPRDLDNDCALAESAGCNCLFAPSVTEMYPAGYSTHVNVGPVGEVLCGAARPGHFNGVATVVLKLFNIVAPHAAVFGAKDAQQVVVVKRLVTDMNLPVRILTGPTLRTPDGLAMSSRNAYLTPSERKYAANISKGLFEAKKMFEEGERSVEHIKERVVSIINMCVGMIQVEYAEIVNPVSLHPLIRIEQTALVVVACRTRDSKTRLIDNIVLG